MRQKSFSDEKSPGFQLPPRAKSLSAQALGDGNFFVSRIKALKVGAWTLYLQNLSIQYIGTSSTFGIFKHKSQREEILCKIFKGRKPKNENVRSKTHIQEPTLADTTVAQVSIPLFGSCRYLAQYGPIVTFDCLVSFGDAFVVDLPGLIAVWLSIYIYFQCLVFGCSAWFDEYSFFFFFCVWIFASLVSHLIFVKLAAWRAGCKLEQLLVLLDVAIGQNPGQYRWRPNNEPLK